MTTLDNTKCSINRRSVTNRHFKQLKRSLGHTVQSNGIVLGQNLIRMICKDSVRTAQ